MSNNTWLLEVWFVSAKVQRAVARLHHSGRASSRRLLRDALDPLADHRKARERESERKQGRSHLTSHLRRAFGFLYRLFSEFGCFQSSEWSPTLKDDGKSKRSPPFRPFGSVCLSSLAIKLAQISFDSFRARQQAESNRDETRPDEARESPPRLAGRIMSSRI